VSQAQAEAAWLMHMGEGKEKGEKWCKRAIWANTLPEVKRIWKSVENLTSGVFLNMWQHQVAHFYAHYSGAATTTRGSGLFWF
jgi:hypothetical protein